MQPLFSVCEITTFPASYEDDLGAYAAAGAQGIGICEFKLNGDNDKAVSCLHESGLAATICVPSTPSILPLPLIDGPGDPAERVDAICSSIRRLSLFKPAVCLCLTGPRGARSDDEARRIVVHGLRRIAQAAKEVGVRVGLEPIHHSIVTEWSIVSTIPEAIALLDEVAEPDLGIIYDVWHLWDTPSVLTNTHIYASRVFGVHVNDRRNPTRSWSDRVLPGAGIIDLPAILGALESGGYTGWYDLEVFSDDGTFGHEYEDSLWKRPSLEVVRAGREGFMRAWEQRAATLVTEES